MHKDQLKALSELQAMPVVIGPPGMAYVPELQTWSTIAERAQHRRQTINSIAHAGMSLEELHLFFARAGLAAAHSWNNGQSFLGQIKNMMTTNNPGFAEVPGRILKQALTQLQEDPDQEVSPAATYLLRADVALDFRDQFEALRAVSE
ncbi:MAG: hypothetical protein AB8B82_02470 [Roseovarius sp.]